jgi:hypothetical protein
VRWAGVQEALMKRVLQQICAHEDG